MANEQDSTQHQGNSQSRATGRPLPKPKVIIPRQRSPQGRPAIAPFRPAAFQEYGAKAPMPAPDPVIPLPSTDAVMFTSPLLEPEPVALPDPLPEELPPPQRKPRSPRPTRRFRIPTHWQFWSLLAVIGFIGAGAFSIALLLKIPALPNCPAIFWPTASASLRLYCAQLAANKQTVEDLLEAIALVDSLPDDHPLRPEINENIETWALTILDLADETFHQGELEEAIASVRRIPNNTTAHDAIQDRIQRWRTIWAEAESIYQQAEDAMLAQDLRQAFLVANRLLDVGNDYWATVKYQELNDLITASREDSARLARARNLMNRGGLSNLLEAIKLAENIDSDSPAHSVALRLIGEAGEKMLDLAETTLRGGDADEAIAIVRQIPDAAGVQNQSQDFIQLAMAQSQAWGGSVADLESAILQAQRLGRDRPLYSRAQELIQRWRLEIQDVRFLANARQYASYGDVPNLRAAIAEAENVPRSNPRYSEAREAIAEWTAQIETIEDQPYLDQAEQLARGGDIFSLQAAINEASRIASGRALYGEAQDRIDSWRSQIQRIQDRPYLDEARRLAATGNIPGAIAAAQRIQSGRALYDEAQANIQSWRNQVEGQARLEEARVAASIGTPSGFLSAIRTADQIPSGNPSRSEADRLINAWSQSILALARERASYDLQGAIAIANSIPPRTEAYAAAQLQIQTWQQATVPVAPPVITDEGNGI